MTTFVESRVKTLLLAAAPVVALVVARIYPDQLKQGCAMPAIRYSRISTVPINSLDGYSDAGQVMIEIDCYATEKAEAMGLAVTVIDAMKVATTFNALYVGHRATFEEQSRLYKNIIEFSCWNDTD